MRQQERQRAFDASEFKSAGPDELHARVLKRKSEVGVWPTLSAQKITG